MSDWLDKVKKLRVLGMEFTEIVHKHVIVNEAHTICDIRKCYLREKTYKLFPLEYQERKPRSVPIY